MGNAQHCWQQQHSREASIAAGDVEVVDMQ
jgi:hypothetical protein